jgi:hypothetical protein
LGYQARAEANSRNYELKEFGRAMSIPDRYDAIRALKRLNGDDLQELSQVGQAG